MHHPVDRMLQSAVLFLIFNRPDPTARVFDAIRSARPSRLYVAADGAREGRPGEAERVAMVRQIATAVDWPCEVRTLFRDRNLGCKRAVSEGITWFFSHEEAGIILEDDCLPGPSFFRFCEELLEKYRHDPRVWAISGANFHGDRHRGRATYFFSHYVHIWGWATWRRAWSQYDADLGWWSTWRRSRAFRGAFPDAVERRYWLKTIDRVARGEVDTWDYQWFATMRRHGGVAASPNVNLVSNIGFGADATHTQADEASQSEIAVGVVTELEHPEDVAPDAVADAWLFDWHFGGRNLRMPRRLIAAPRVIWDRLRSWLSRK